MAVYEDIADELRAEIDAGVYGPGDQLPAESDLAARFDRSVPTIRQAVGVLVGEGLVDKEHGRGNFVRTPRTRVIRTNERHQWEKDRARQPQEVRATTGATEHDTGLTVSDLRFHAAYKEISADQDTATLFDVCEGDPLLERTYRTTYAQERHPFSLVRSLLPKALVEANPDLLDATREPWPGGTQSQLHTVGIEVNDITEHVTARPPTNSEARELGLKSGVAILLLRKISTDTTGRVVEVSDVVLPGDRTDLVFKTPLKRW